MSIKLWKGAICLICGPTLGAIMGWLQTDGLFMGYRVLLFRAPETYNDKQVRLHEYAHLLQAKRDKLFSLRYVICLFQCGYQNNPYEVEANNFSEAWYGLPLSSFVDDREVSLPDKECPLP
jgi:hypothetical protein